MLRRLFPHPYVSVLLIVVWMLLVNEAKLGSLIFAIILGIIIPKITAPYWPNSPKISNPLAIAGYLMIVIYDIIKSNFIVAGIVLFKPRSQLRPAWVPVPLDIRKPEAITVLAGTITMTPGTLTADMSADGRTLLVHCLHAPDPSGVSDEIKNRYESRLKRIFE
ncbi:MAG: Na+/H+ antiporter subunit E [Pseudorhodobacter sp.]